MRPVYLLYWYKRVLSLLALILICVEKRESKAVAPSLLALLVQKLTEVQILTRESKTEAWHPPRCSQRQRHTLYLLYWYKSTNTDARE